MTEALEFRKNSALSHTHTTSPAMPGPKQLKPSTISNAINIHLLASIAAAAAAREMQFIFV